MSLYVKMAQIMAEIKFLPKDGRNEHFSYAFVADSTVYDTVRSKMAEKGIALFASMVAVEQQRIIKGTDKNGAEKAEWHTRAQFEFVLVDSETGETVKCTWFAESLDSQDKGINKCATAALKYWLLKTFIIPTGDDPDADGPTDAPKAKPKTAPASKPAVPPPAPKTNGQPSAATVNGGSEDTHWSLKPNLRGNFDRAMTNSNITETMIKTAMGADDPSASLDSLLLGYSTVGEAIAAVLTYAKEHAAS